MQLCGFNVGLDQRFFLIAGTCSIEGLEMSLDVAGQLKEACAPLGIPLIYKGSFDKANRSSGTSKRGVGLDAGLREHLRIPGMGDTTARYFRDKLAMRVQARDKGIAVPEFVHVLNYPRLHEFMARVPAPWVLKPRSEASSMGIKKIHNADELWQTLETLWDRQSYYVLEKFVPGDVYHVDSIVDDKQVLFSISNKYGLPPMTVYQGGGVFVTSTLPYGGEEDQALTQVRP